MARRDFESSELLNHAAEESEARIGRDVVAE